MIEQITLDDETYSEITQRAVGQIQELCAEWTDYNGHDPGITMLEMLAWLKEMQQFHLDQIGEAHERKYQKLLGIKPRGRIPAETEVRIENLKEQTYFLAGSRFFAEDVCFESVEAGCIGGVCVVELVSERAGKEKQVWRPGEGRRETGMRFWAFGERPKPGDRLRIGFDAPLAPGKEHRLFFRFYRETRIKRNPIKEGFIPLAEYRLSYHGRTGYREAHTLLDTTHQMLEDGFLSFSIEEEMEGDGCYWLDIELVRSDYDIPPVIESISASCLKVRQTRTYIAYYETEIAEGRALLPDTYLAHEGECELFIREEGGFYRYAGPVVKSREEAGESVSFPGDDSGRALCLILAYEAEYKDRVLLAVGSGMPYQKYPVRIRDLCGKSIAVLAETKSGSGHFVFWEACEDFDASTPMDRHFHFEEETGVISFGDCVHGLAPEGKIYLVHARATLGAAGNVTAGSICGAPKGIVVTNDRDASGGADAETLRQRRERFRMRLQERRRAVTCEDFEYLAKRTPGLLIENVRAVCGGRRTGGVWEETVSVVVKPYSKEERPVLGEARRKNIQNALEAARMIGTKVKVLSPVYIGVTIFVKVTVSIHVNAAKTEIERLLKEFFEKIEADFGSVIAYSSIYGIIDVLDWVSEIQSLSIDAQGNNIRRGRNGDILLPANGLAYLLECIVC